MSRIVVFSVTRFLNHPHLSEKDAKYRPVDANQAGLGNATSGSITDTLTRDHRMTLDEAHLILNVKKGEAMEKILQVRVRSHLITSPLTTTLSFPCLRITNTSSKQTHHLSLTHLRRKIPTLCIPITCSPRLYVRKSA